MRFPLVSAAVPATLVASIATSLFAVPLSAQSLTDKVKSAAQSVVQSAVLPIAAPAIRPFGTLRDQAAMQQQWLELRMTRVLPALMRKYGVDMWVVPMREYNEDPVFSSMVSPTTFAARRRTIYVVYDACAALPVAKQGACTTPVEKLAFGGSSQGGVFTAVRSMKKAPGDAATQGRTAELWGDEQWQVLKQAIEQRKPKKIGINMSRTFAFADGLSSGEYEGMREAVGPTWAKKFTRAEGLAVEFIATRLPEEEAFYGQLQLLVWQLIGRMFSNEVVKPGVTKTSDLVWWWRQQVNDLGLGTWFQPSVAVQRAGKNGDELGEDTIIEKGDVLWCDVGITAMRLNTDTQHQGYVLKDGETDAPAGLQQALKNANALQDILLDETKPGRSGNEILKSSLARLKAAGLDGTLYSHPIGMHGHGSGPIIGLWDYQDGVPGRGDFKVIPSMWFSAELQVTTPVAEWGGQKVRVAQEEDFYVMADSTRKWANGRQTSFWLVK